MDWSIVTAVLGGTLGGNAITQMVVLWYGARQRRKERVQEKGDAHRTTLRASYAAFIAGVDECTTLVVDLATLMHEYLDLKAQVEGFLERLADITKSQDDVKATLDELDNARTPDAAVREKIAKLHADSELVRAKHARLTTDVQQASAGANHAKERGEAMYVRFPGVVSSIRVKGIELQLLEGDQARRFALQGVLDALPADEIYVGGTISFEDEGTVKRKIETLAKFIQDFKARRSALMSLLAGIDAPAPS